MAASLLRGLKLDFGLKCHFNRNILPSASKSVLSFALSIGIKVRIKLNPFNNKYILESVRFRLDKFTTFLLTKLPCNLLSKNSVIVHALVVLEPTECSISSRQGA